MLACLVLFSFLHPSGRGIISLPFALLWVGFVHLISPLDPFYFYDAKRDRLKDEPYMKHILFGPSPANIHRSKSSLPFALSV
jgi:hypothetical protein